MGSHFGTARIAGTGEVLLPPKITPSAFVRFSPVIIHTLRFMTGSEPKGTSLRVVIVSPD